VSAIAPDPAHMTVAGWRRPRLRSIGFLPAAALAATALVVILGLLGPWIAPQDPSGQNLALGVSAPSADHWLGTDPLGRDIFSRVIAGARSAVFGPIVVAVGAMLIGNVLGLLAGYFGGWRDSLLMRVVDVVYSLPALIVAIVVVGVLGGSYGFTLGVLIFLFAPHDTRIVRAATLEQRALPYVEAARLVGVGPARIMARHIWPNLAWLVVAQTFLTFALCLVTMASLSFLGLGVPPGTPDWGRMLAEGQDALFDNPAAAIAPGVLIALTAASMTVVGDWVHETIAARGGARGSHDG
jgi:peptide/nickel transport system permease protein